MKGKYFDLRKDVLTHLSKYVIISPKHSGIGKADYAVVIEGIPILLYPTK